MAIFGSQGYGIDAFREDEKKFLISAGAGAAKVRSVVVMHRLGEKRFTGEIEIAAFEIDGFYNLFAKG